MSVRRLADDMIQPPAFAFSAENQAWAETVMARYPAGRQQSAVIPVLWRAQEQEGWVTRAAIEAVAQLLGMAYINLAFIGISGKLTVWMGLAAEPSIWISFVFSLCVLVFVVRKG